MEHRRSQTGTATTMAMELFRMVVQVAVEVEMDMPPATMAVVAIHQAMVAAVVKRLIEAATTELCSMSCCLSQ